jgi:hypothetical protein
VSHRHLSVCKVCPHRTTLRTQTESCWKNAMKSSKLLNSISEWCSERKYPPRAMQNECLGSRSEAEPCEHAATWFRKCEACLRFLDILGPCWTHIPLITHHISIQNSQTCW